MNDIPIGPIRESYDRLAKEYTNHLFHELANKPFDRDLLDRFAAGMSGQVCDMGCGPGHVARYVRDAGVNVFGLDLSTQMLEQARQRNPDIHFREGNMLALDLQESTLAGITAFYATVNLPPESWPLVFREMERVLQPNGLLLLAFHIGSEVTEVKELWGLPVSLNFFFVSESVAKRHLESAGFRIEEVIQRGPYPPEVEYQSQRAYIFARKRGETQVSKARPGPPTSH
jgi:ubiquinone/menaquinone biosynthesis C-methylase UbiE